MIKTEMHGTGGGRWMARADAKDLSNAERRHVDRHEVAARLAETGYDTNPAPGEWDDWEWDAVLETYVDNRPLTVTLVEAIR